MTVADLLVDELKARGVPFIATLNGHGLDPFYLACRRAGMRMIDVRNEQAARSALAAQPSGWPRRYGDAMTSVSVAASVPTGFLRGFQGAM